MAPLFLVLFLITLLFDTRIGLCFLVAAIVVLYRRAPAKKRKALFGDEATPATWKDPWETGGLGP
jgi:hypothetical protein